MFRCVQLRRVWATLAFVSIALSMASGAFAQDAVTLSGIITTRIDGQPVAGAVVTLSRFEGNPPAQTATSTATTASDGTYQFDGLDTSAPGVATVSVRLPPKAPAVRIRTGRTHLLRGERIHVLVECPPIAIGPCRVAVHLFVAGQSKGYGFSRVVRRATQVVVTVRDRSRRATVVRRTILILP